MPLCHGLVQKGGDLVWEPPSTSLEYSVGSKGSKVERQAKARDERDQLMMVTADLRSRQTVGGMKGVASKELLADFRASRKPKPVVSEPASFQHRDLAEEAFQAREYEATISHITNAIRNRHQAPLATDFFLRGEAHRLLCNNEKALADYASSLELEPWAPPCYYARGLCLKDLGDVTQAAEEFEKSLLIQNPETSSLIGAKTYASLGECRTALEQYQASLDCFSKAIEASDDHSVLAHCHFSRAEVHQYLGDMDAAKVDFAKCLEHNPDYARSLLQFASDEMAAGRHQSAVIIYTRLVPIRHNDFVLYKNRGVCFMQMALSLSGISGTLADELAAEAMEDEETAADRRELLDSAITDFTTCVTLDRSRDAMVYHDRAECYLRQGLLDNANSDWTVLLSYTPHSRDLDGLVNHGGGMVLKGNLEEACADYAKVFAEVNRPAGVGYLEARLNDLWGNSHLLLTMLSCDVTAKEVNEAFADLKACAGDMSAKPARWHDAANTSRHMNASRQQGFTQASFDSSLALSSALKTIAEIKCSDITMAAEAAAAAAAAAEAAATDPPTPFEPVEPIFQPPSLVRFCSEVIGRKLLLPTTTIATSVGDVQFAYPSLIVPSDEEAVRGLLSGGNEEASGDDSGSGTSDEAAAAAAEAAANRVVLTAPEGRAKVGLYLCRVLADRVLENVVQSFESPEAAAGGKKGSAPVLTGEPFGGPAGDSARSMALLDASWRAGVDLSHLDDTVALVAHVVTSAREYKRKADPLAADSEPFFASDEDASRQERFVPSLSYKAAHVLCLATGNGTETHLSEAVKGFHVKEQEEEDERRLAEQAALAAGGAPPAAADAARKKKK